ncbi:uncharacterized protein [Rutidosis leptorrhynchoides]|uniref:uncharacterized protein n=1 Tax=Rutidosis leptorrhynchoides TaxID=125765 RepID=UPI003A99713A
MACFTSAEQQQLPFMVKIHDHDPQIKVKYNFVNGRIQQPDESDANFPNWDRCNITVSCWIMNSVSASIQPSISIFKTAHAMWKDLQGRFFKTDFSRISDIQEEIFTFKQGDLNISDYYTKMRILWDEFDDLRPIPEYECAIKCECKTLKTIADYYENDKIIRFLKGVNAAYAQTRSTIMMMDPTPSLEKAFATVAQYERRNILPPDADEPTLAAFSSTKGPR